MTVSPPPSSDELRAHYPLSTEPLGKFTLDRSTDEAMDLLLSAPISACAELQGYPSDAEDVDQSQIHDLQLMRIALACQQHLHKHCTSCFKASRNSTKVDGAATCRFSFPRPLTEH
jgi:hypothetical protein